MKLVITDWKEEANGPVSFNLRIYGDVIDADNPTNQVKFREISTVRLTVANPTISNLRTAIRSAVLGNIRSRAERVVDALGQNLETG